MTQNFVPECNIKQLYIMKQGVNSEQGNISNVKQINSFLPNKNILSINRSNEVKIPDFNHQAVHPSIFYPYEGLTVEQINKTVPEKIEHRRRINRESQKICRDKTKGYTQLAHLPTINDKLKQVWLLTYPDLYSNIESDVFDALITQSVDSIYLLMHLSS